MYSIAAYESMIDDGVRMEAYAAALRQAVKPGSVVLDIGAGTGVMSLLACRFGARRVYAIEPDDAILVARQYAAAGGMAERIEFIQDLSTKVSLPEKADVVVSDLRGVLPLLQKHLPSVIHARTNFLATGGALIPQRDTLWLTVAEEPGPASDQPARWDRAALGLDLSAGEKYVANTMKKTYIEPELLLTRPLCWAEIDYTQVESADCAGQVSAVVARDGLARAIVAWFDTVLLRNIGFSNAPGEPKAIYGMMRFPLRKATPVRKGDTIEVRLEAHAGDDDYVWRWATRVRCHETGAVTAEYDQSSFFEAPVSPQRLRKAADDYVPALNDDGLVDQFILACMRGGESLGTIARQLSEQFPGRFESWRHALKRVGKLSTKYSR